MSIVNQITVYRGQDATLDFTEVDSAGVARDITGWTIAMTISRRRNMAAKVATIDGAIVLAASGTYRLLLPAATLDLSPSTYYFDVWHTNAGAMEPMSVGTLIVKSDSYRPS